MRSIGVIGCGVVGAAVAKAFAIKGCKVSTYDKYIESGVFHNILDTEIVFLCLPTPTTSEGLQEVTALKETLSKLANNKYQGIIVVKSTVLPGTTQALAEKYFLPKVVHNPEFLTAANPYEDFMKQPAVLIGGPIHAAMEVGDFYYELGFKNIMLRKSASYTEMAKYMHNIMLASKLNMANEFFERCEKEGIDYKNVVDCAQAIGQIGETHLAVPGSDGKRGYNGMCFPKDTKALHTWDVMHNLPGEELLAVLKGNSRRRPEEM